MNKKILLAEALLALLIVLGFKLASTTNDRPHAVLADVRTARPMQVIGCSPNWALLNMDSLGAAISPLPGWGNYSWPISSPSDSARFYFNQGINMYYAFHIIEAMASFKKAEMFDPKDPMIYWGQALAYGPNINDFAYSTVPDAIAAAEKAASLATSANAREKGLINAMLVRYSTDSTISRKELNQRYATAMKSVYHISSGDADAGALYADALMLQHPWEYWQHNGQAHAWTPEIVAVLETVIKKNPGHPGANHYYIHMMEASPKPGKALASADRLRTMMPDVSHMVHMPSHIYIRTGNYEKGMQVNDRSLEGYDKYKQLYPEVINNAFLYAIHNYHMKAACAMMRPNYQHSLKAANACISSFDTAFLSMPHPLGNFIQYVYLTPQMVNVRYGKWDAILKAAAVHDNYGFAFLLDRWARGMAYANSGNLPAAKKALNEVMGRMKDSSLRIRLEPFNIPFDQAVVAQKILQGTIAEKENNLPEAIRIFRTAVLAEDQLIYTEPRDWLIPTRHYLANVLLKSHAFTEAHAVLTKDLEINPNNFYSLRGMEQVAEQQKNSAGKAGYAKQLKLAWKDSDMVAPALVYQ